MQERTDQLLTTREALVLLDISRSTLYRLMQQGLVQPVTFPSNAILKKRRLRFSRAFLESLLSATTTPHHQTGTANPVSWQEKD
jgi:predicted DNA-binding transcriptional regulator AlpA